MRTLPSGRGQSGFTLVELMIAMLLGLILTGGVVSLFVQSRQSFAVDENVARMQNQARYALDELSRDLRMASFVAEPLVPGGILRDPTANVAEGCGPAGDDDWILDFTDAVGNVESLTGLDNATGAGAAAAYGCIDSGEFQANTDVVAIKRVAGDTTDTIQANRLYVESNGTVASLYKNAPGAPVGGPTQSWEYRPRIYYIRDYSVTANDGIPTLCRKVLGAGAPTPIETDCIAEGIENLQLEYGLDPDENGTVNRYVTDPDIADMQFVVAARITLLARTVQPDRKYVDDRTYRVGNSGNYKPDDNFHRRLYTVTVTVHNLRNLHRLGI